MPSPFHWSWYCFIFRANTIERKKLSDHFFQDEFDCPCGQCECPPIARELIIELEHVRKYFGEPITITSGYRCKIHNEKVGGAKMSKHRFAEAADFKVKNVNPKAVQDYLELMHPYQYGIGRYARWTHFDVRETKARW